MEYLKKIGAILAVGFLALPLITLPVHAQLDTYLDDVGEGAGMEDTPLAETIGSLISVVLSVLGIVLLVIIIYSGFLWMTAGGDSDKTKKARDWMINAVIGLIIILAAYAISNFVIDALVDAGVASS